MSKSKTNPGKKFRAGVNKASRDRNWTNLETDAYASILADGESNYALTLETKALTLFPMGGAILPPLA